jgi:spore germination cell wall hydrolase CwlJ-like protein
MLRHDFEFFSSLPVDELLARCIYGEARGEPDCGKVAIVNVVFNRTGDGKDWNGNDIRSVILKPYQFSCFNADDPNFVQLRANSIHGNLYAFCRTIAMLALDDVFRDLTGGATHYYAAWLKQPPSWAAKMRHTVKIGSHLFFKEI